MTLTLIALLTLAQGDYAPGRAGTDPLDVARERSEERRVGKECRL